MILLESISEWFFSFGTSYGVDPIIFTALYFGTIPISLLAFRVVIKNKKAGKSIIFPVFLTFISFIGTYIYLFWVGKDLPAWVYGLVIGMMILGFYQIAIRLKNSFKEN